MDANLLLLFGRARALLLGAFHHADPAGAALHLRELARRTGLSPTAVQYELRLLRQLDLIRDVGTDSRPTYVLNRDHDLYEGLKNLFTRPAAGPLFDEPQLERKRAQQRSDRRRSAAANSPFLRHRRTS